MSIALRGLGQHLSLSITQLFKQERRGGPGPLGSVDGIWGDGASSADVADDRERDAPLSGTASPSLAAMRVRLLLFALLCCWLLSYKITHQATSMN